VELVNDNYLKYESQWLSRVARQREERTPNEVLKYKS